MAEESIPHLRAAALALARAHAVVHRWVEPGEFADVLGGGFHALWQDHAARIQSLADDAVPGNPAGVADLLHTLAAECQN